jgi:hypothetical protein
VVFIFLPGTRHQVKSQDLIKPILLLFSFFFFTFTFYCLLVFAGRLRGRCYKMPTMLLQHVQDRCR